MRAQEQTGLLVKYRPCDMFYIRRTKILQSDLIPTSYLQVVTISPSQPVRSLLDQVKFKVRDHKGKSIAEIDPAFSCVLIRQVILRFEWL